MDYNNDSDVDDFDEGSILNVETQSNFQFNKDNTFNHYVLVMRVYMKVQDALAQEMREGHNEIFTDNKGKTQVVYHKDSREEAIESIETLKNTMIADIQETIYKTNIENYYKELNNKFMELVNQQNNYIKMLNYGDQKELSNSYPDLNFVLSFNKLHPDLPFGQEWISFRVKIYRKIFEELELCLSNNKYYKKQRTGN